MPGLMVENEMIEHVDYFTHPGSLISASELVTDEISRQIQKAQLALVNLRHPRCRRDVLLPIKGRIYKEAVLCPTLWL